MNSSSSFIISLYKEATKPPLPGKEECLKKKAPSPKARAESAFETGYEEEQRLLRA
jgi:hypothetical protein